MTQVTKLFIRTVIVLGSLLAAITVAGTLFGIIMTLTDSRAISGLISAIVGIYIAYKLSKWIIRKQSEPSKSKEASTRSSKRVSISLLVIGVVLFLPILQGLQQRLSVVAVVLSLMGLAAICVGAHQIYKLNKTDEQQL